MKTVNYLGNDLTELSTSHSAMPDQRIKMTDNIYNIQPCIFPTRWQSGQSLS